MSAKNIVTAVPEPDIGPTLLRATDPKMQKVLNYIRDANLRTDDLSSARLAEIAGLSLSGLKKKFYHHANLSTRQYVIIQRIKNIQRLIREGIPAEKAAEASGYSKGGVFWKLFKETVGCTPGEYAERHMKRREARNKKIEDSKDHMRDMSLSLREVAERSGFNSYTDFQRVFRDKVGVWPSDFRHGIPEEQKISKERRFGEKIQRVFDYLLFDADFEHDDFSYRTMAKKAGFRSLSNFTIQSKAFTGMTFQTYLKKMIPVFQKAREVLKGKMFDFEEMQQIMEGESPEEIDEKFKSLTGRTLTEYRRIMLAVKKLKEDIASSKDPFKELAQAYGFENLDQMSDMFRLVTGISLKSYRHHGSKKAWSSPEDDPSVDI